MWLGEWQRSLERGEPRGSFTGKEGQFPKNGAGEGGSLDMGLIERLGSLEKVISDRGSEGL